MLEVSWKVSRFCLLRTYGSSLKLGVPYKTQLRIAPPPLPSSPRLLHRRPPPDAMTFHLPGGIICLDCSDSSIGSDVEEIVKWDDRLRKTKTFSTAYLILVGRKYGSPLLDKQQTHQPVEDYFRQNTLQAKAFAEIMTICKAGWNAETSRKKKWTARFVAENLALQLVIRREEEGQGDALC